MARRADELRAITEVVHCPHPYRQAAGRGSGRGNSGYDDVRQQVAEHFEPASARSSVQIDVADLSATGIGDEQGISLGAVTVTRPGREAPRTRADDHWSLERRVSQVEDLDLVPGNVGQVQSILAGVIQRVGNLPAERQHAGNSGHYCNRVDAVRPAHQLGICSDAVRVPREYLDIGGRREVRVRQLHLEGVRLERQLPVRDECRRVIDRATRRASHLVAQLADAAGIVRLDVNGIGDFDALAVTALVVEA